MKKNKSIIYGIIITLLVTLLLLGLTYAFYRTRVVGNTEDKSVSIKAKNLSIKYVDGTDKIIEEKDIEPGVEYIKDFSVENTGEEEAKYSIILDNKINEYFRTEDWEWVLKKEEAEIAKGTIFTTQTQVLYAEDTIEARKTNNYKLEVRYKYLEDIDQSIDMGKKMSFRVNIDEPYTTWENAKEGTLLYAIRESRSSMEKKPLTTPGQQVSLAEEKVLAETEDDYGISYYFRGAVDNNYVTFANMCWRIVRVQGDGSIKLILADGEHICNSEEFKITNPNTSFIDTSKFANSYSNKETVRYDQSYVSIKINEWLETKQITENEYINKEAEWCIDVSESSMSGSTIQFGPRDRLYPSNSIKKASPILKCKFIGISNSKAEKYVGAAGLLSGDEVAFAGSVTGVSNNNYYLNQNATTNKWWTLSPCHYRSSDADVWGVYPTGNLNNATLKETNSIRPALVLKSNVQIEEGGIGTKEKPYIIT